MGFLDKRDRIVDIVLTEHGRRQFALGRMRFTYFAVFDDGLDYDPINATGSYSDADRIAQMETIPMFEAPYVRDRQGTVGLFEPVSHVFTAADGFSIVPQISTPATSSFSVVCDQYAGSDGGPRYQRRASSRASMEPSLSGDVEAHAHGFTVRVFVSGAAGLSELHPRRDSAFRRALDPFIACDIDDEPRSDAASKSDPRSFRR